MSHFLTMLKEPKWTIADMPPQNGKLAIVTGATGGLGYETALALAKAGATVIVAGRNETKGKEAIDKILTECPDSQVSFGKVDLGSLESTREFATQFLKEHDSLDLLVNNAGVMSKTRQVTCDGFEIQFGTNHLSHFALTALLLPALRKSPAPRVVTVSSSLAMTGKIHFDDLQWETQKYCGWLAYSQSKLANLLFTFELQRKSDAAGWGIFSAGAHPGYSRTDMTAEEPNAIQKMLSPFLSQSAADGALCTLYAATSPDAEPAQFYGPQGLLGTKGRPGLAAIPCAAKKEPTAAQLWDVSCQLTGVNWG